MNVQQYYKRSINQALPFISQWNTANISAGSSASNQIRLPLSNFQGALYDFFVDWGDGSSDQITAFNQEEATHTYSIEGTYTITIRGICKGFRFNNSGDRLKILDIISWGDIEFFAPGTNIGAYFFGCSNLDISAIDEPNFSSVSRIDSMFRNCTSLVGNSSWSNWVFVNVTNSALCFQNCSNFNAPIGNWNLKNSVINQGFLQNCSSFNQDLSAIELRAGSANTDFLANCISFNSKIPSIMKGNCLRFLSGCTSYNTDLLHVNTDEVTNIREFFQNCTNFNQSLSHLNFSNLTGDNRSIFLNCTNFNGSVNNLIGAGVTNILTCFFNCRDFNQSLSTWDVRNVISIGSNLFSNLNSMSAENYDSTLIAWSNLPLQNNVVAGFANIQRTSAGTAARQLIIDNFNWTIIDGGQL